MQEKQKTELWESHVLQAWAAIERENLPEAGGLLGYALQEAREYGERDARVGHVHGQLGVLEHRKGSFDSAKSHLEQAISIFADAGEAFDEARALMYMGLTTVHRSLSQSGDAIKCLKEAIDLLDSKTEDAPKRRLNDALLALGIELEKTNQPEASYAVFRRALTVEEQLVKRTNFRLEPTLCKLSGLAAILNLEEEKKQWDERLSQIEPEDLDQQQSPDFRFTTSDVLNILVEHEHRSYSENRKYLGDTVLLFQKMTELYDQLAVLLESARFVTDGESLYAFTCCLHGCRYQLLMGAMTLLRGHRTDSATYVRKAIEFSAFSVVILRNEPASRQREVCAKCASSQSSEPQESNPQKENQPTMGHIWLHAAESERKFQKYRSKFDIMAALKKTKDSFPEIYKKYEELSKQVHPTSLAISGHTRVEGSPDGINHIFEYFEHRGENKLHLIVYSLFWAIQAHFEILSCLAAELRTVSKFDHDEFSTAMNEFQSVFYREKEKWRPIIDPEGKFKPKQA